MPWYKAGTVTVTSGSPNVVGSGTTWGDGAVPEGARDEAQTARQNGGRQPGSLKLRICGAGDTYGNALNGKTSSAKSSHVWGHILAMTQTGASETIDTEGYVTYTAISE